MDVENVRLNPNERITITVEELTEHIFSVIKRAKREPRWYRNYPTVLQNLLLDLCRDSEQRFFEEQVDGFSPKFDEAITLLKKLDLIVDVTTPYTYTPTVRLSSIGEKSDGKEIRSQQNADPEARMKENKPSVPHVFISYVHENQDDVDRLCDDLVESGIEVWLDRDNIKAGARWRDAIEEAIQNGAYFLACFSKEYNERDESYMNEELTLAVDRLRKMPTDRTWFIPVKLNKCEIPNRRISAVETLRDLQWVEFYRDWNGGVQRILKVVKPNDGRPSEGYEFELADPARSTTSAFESEFKNFLARLEIEWNDERNSDPINIYEGQRILEDAYQEVLQFRVQIATINDEVSEADTILSEAARLLKAIQQHQVYLDGGKSYKAFWEKGDGIIDLLKDAFDVLRQQKVD